MNGWAWGGAGIIAALVVANYIFWGKYGPRGGGG